MGVGGGGGEYQKVIVMGNRMIKCSYQVKKKSAFFNTQTKRWAGKKEKMAGGEKICVCGRKDQQVCKRFLAPLVCVFLEESAHFNSMPVQLTWKRSSGCTWRVTCHPHPCTLTRHGRTSSPRCLSLASWPSSMAPRRRSTRPTRTTLLSASSWLACRLSSSVTSRWGCVNKM